MKNIYCERCGFEQSVSDADTAEMYDCPDCEIVVRMKDDFQGRREI